MTLAVHSASSTDLLSMNLRLALLGLLCCTLVWCSAIAAERPNIVLILADDLGYSDLGCYGGEIGTPHVDALAAEGVRFTQFYNSARCCPSRASLMTGLYPSQAGIGDFTTGKPSPTRGPGYLGRLNNQCATLAEVLGAAGYGCYYVGKWHMHEETGPILRGFDEFYGYTRGHSHDQYDADYYLRLPEGRKKEIDPPTGEYYATDVFNEYAIEFIRQGQKRGKPWFVFLGHSSPHFPVQAPAERADRHEATYLRGWDALREERYDRMQKIGLIDGKQWKLTPRAIVPVDRDDIANGYSGKQNPAWNSLDEPRQRDLARRMAVFAAMVETVDQGVGQIVDHLKKTDDLENTLILFLSDNGACYEWGPFGFDGTSRRGTTMLRTGDELRKTGGPGTHQSYGSAWANLGNTPLRLYKHFTHEGGISTPMIAHWPAGIGKPDKWIRAPAHVMDVMPTLIEATGAKYPEELRDNSITPVEGTSLLPLMRGQCLPDRSIGFDHQGARALRQGDWKLIWSKRMPHEIEWELYNLAEDRCETNDLAAKHPERMRMMAADWERWARHVRVIYEPKTNAGKPPTNTATGNTDSPQIANQPLAIVAEVDAPNPKGVILAQGGREHGFALHFVDGKPAFDVRVNGKVTRLVSDKPIKGTIRLRATLDGEKMALAVNDEPTVSAASPGLIPVQPKDALTIGFDSLTAAGDYEAPCPFNGTVVSTRVDCDGKPPVVPPAMNRATIEAGLKSHDRALYIKEVGFVIPSSRSGPTNTTT
jgi:arylsulfatase A-like enzyme